MRNYRRHGRNGRGLRKYNGVIAKAKRYLREHVPCFPCYLGECVGRESQLAQMHDWYQHSDAPLLTLVGPSGIGKTHLACEFARQVRDRGEPCLYINLTLLNSPDKILDEIFHTLNISMPDVNARPVLLQRLFNQRTLLVLDDFDLLLPNGATVVRELLHSAPALKILATSQQPLALERERLLELPPLPLPPADWKPRSIQDLQTNPSTAVLISQMSDKLSHLPRNLERLVTLCRDLKGHPGNLVWAGLYLQHESWENFYRSYRVWLGIEASPRTPEAQQRRLFHQMRAVKQRVFQCLTVFPESFTAEFAAAAAQISLTKMELLLQELQEKKWLQAVPQTEPVRYQFKQQIKRLIPPLNASQKASVMERLYLQYSHWLQQSLQSCSDAARKRQRCFEEQQNLELTLEFLAQTGRSEAVAQMLHQIVELCAHRPPARLLDWGASYVLNTQGLSQEAQTAVARPLLSGFINSGYNECAEAIVNLLEPQPLIELGRYRHNVADGERARQYYLRAIEYAEQTRDRAKIVCAIADFAECEAVLGNLQNAEHLLRRARKNHNLSRLDEMTRSWYHYVAGYICYQRGHFRRAQAHYLIALRCEARRADVLRELSRVNLEMGRYSVANEQAHEALALLEDKHQPLLPSIHALYGCLGDICAVQGKYEEAYRYHSEALSFWQKTGQPRWICLSLNRIAEIELLARDAGSSWRVAATMGKSAYELLREAWQVIEPTYMNLPHKSRTLHNLGWLAWHEGRITDAEKYLRRALLIRQHYGNEYGVARTLELLARLRFTQQRYNEAKQYFEQAGQIRKQLGVVQYPAVKRCSLSIQRRL